MTSAAALSFDTALAIASQAALLAAVGCFSGFAIALLGVGGGVVLGPALYGGFSVLGVSVDVAAPMAAATSLAIIAWSSARTLAAGEASKTASVRRRDCATMAAGSTIGPVLSAQLSGPVFAGALAAIVAGVGATRVLKAIKHARGRRRDPADASSETPPQSKPMAGATRDAFFAGSGAVAAAFGLGGGLAALIVARASAGTLREAMGAAPAFALAVAGPGVLSFIVLGLGVEGRPLASLGYVHAPSFVAAALTAGVGARWGGWVNARLSDRQLAWTLGGYFAAAAILLGAGALSA